MAGRKHWAILGAAAILAVLSSENAEGQRHRSSFTKTKKISSSHSSLGAKAFSRSHRKAATSSKRSGFFRPKSSPKVVSRPKVQSFSRPSFRSPKIVTRKRTTKVRTFSGKKSFSSSPVLRPFSGSSRVSPSRTFASRFRSGSNHQSAFQPVSRPKTSGFVRRTGSSFGHRSGSSPFARSNSFASNYTTISSPYYGAHRSAFGTTTVRTYRTYRNYGYPRWNTYFSLGFAWNYGYLGYSLAPIFYLPALYYGIWWDYPHHNYYSYSHYYCPIPIYAGDYGAPQYVKEKEVHHVYHLESDQDSYTKRDPAPVEGVGAGVEQELKKLTPSQQFERLGDIFFRNGQYDQAAVAYEKAIREGPGHAALRFILADARFAAGDFHGAALAIRQGLEMNPALVISDLDKRNFYEDPKDFEKQLAELRRFVEKHPADAEALFVLAYNLYFTQQKDEAKKVFEQVKKIKGKDLAADLFLVAQSSGKSGR